MGKTLPNRPVRGDTLRTLTVILSMILVLMLAFCAFFYAGGTLHAEVSRTVAAAADYPDIFAQVQGVLNSNSAPRRFSDEALGDAAAYSLVDVNIILFNRGIFSAEWLNVQPDGADGDVAVYSLTGDGTDVPARSTGSVNLKFVTRAAPDALRRLKIQYYVYGISRTIALNY